VHCNTLINYHKKVESVKKHLNKSSPFHKLMNGMEDSDRPDRYVRKAQTKASKMQKPSLSSVPSKNVSTSRQSSVREFALPAMSRREKIRFQQHVRVLDGLSRVRAVRKAYTIVEARMASRMIV
jgi:hypothetical protein